MKKLLSLVLSFALVCTLISGCGPKGGGGNSSNQPLDAAETTFGLTPLPERTTLTIGFFSGSAHSMPWYIADRMGFFDELNIDVEYESFIGGPAMMEASASWDICDVGAPGILNGMKNYDIQMLGLCDNEYNTALFVRPDSPQAADPTNPEIWKGIECILPTGTTLQYMFLSYLQSLGLSADDVTITNMDVTPALTAFNAGEGDALCVWNAVAYNAEDSGLVRITDVSELGINNVCGLAATKDAMENKSDLIDLAWMVYYLTWDWCQQSEDNMAQAVELYVESCEDEGVVSNESICQRALDIFAWPSPSEAVSVMTTEEEDRLSLADRPVLAAENDLLETMDFFISIGSYTEEDRTAILDKELVNSSVAERCAETLKTLGYLE